MNWPRRQAATGAERVRHMTQQVRGGNMREEAAGKNQLESAGAKPSINRRDILLSGTALAAAGLSGPSAVTPAQAQPVPAPAAGGKKPNILVIFGDDIGVPQISAYT